MALIRFFLVTLITIFIFISSAQAHGFKKHRIDPDTRGLPERGKILFIMGQSSGTLTDYKNQVLDIDPDIPRPGGVTLYTNVLNGIFLAGLGADPFDEFGNVMPGFNLDTNWGYDFGAGSHSFPLTMEEYPDASLAIGLFLSDNFAGCGNQPLRAINAIFRDDIPGDDITPELVAAYENAIDVMVNTLKGFDRDVYLRIGYEFDGQWFCYNTDWYKGAFRYMKERIDALGADNVATVWQSATWPRNEQLNNPEFNYIVTDEDHFDKWYPGDDVVDWVGMSHFYGNNYDLFQWACGDLNPEFFTVSLPPRKLQKRLLRFARKHRKPVMVAESSPQAYQTDELTASCLQFRDETPVGERELWQLWYKDFFKFVRRNREVIRAVAYINADWDTLPQFQCAPGSFGGTPECPGGYWGDARVQANELIFRRFKHEINKRIYVNGRRHRR